MSLENLKCLSKKVLTAMEAHGRPSKVFYSSSYDVCTLVYGNGTAVITKDDIKFCSEERKVHNI